MINTIINNIKYRRVYSVLLYLSGTVSVLLFLINLLTPILSYNFKVILDSMLVISVVLSIIFYIILYLIRIELNKENPAFHVSKFGLFRNFEKLTHKELDIYANAKEITIMAIIIIVSISFISISIPLNNANSDFLQQIQPISAEQELQQYVNQVYYLGIFVFLTFSSFAMILLTSIILPYSILLWDKNFTLLLRSEAKQIVETKNEGSKKLFINILLGILIIAISYIVSYYILGLIFGFIPLFWFI